MSKQKTEDAVKNFLPPFIQAFLDVEIKTIDNKKRQIKELITWDIRGYDQNTKDQKVNERFDLWLDHKSGQWCIRHRAVEKLADIMGVEIDHNSIISHSQPTVDNRYQHIFTLSVVDRDGNRSTYVGEANNAGGGMVQNNYNAYPASMAFKRAFDRAVMKLIVKISRQSYLTKGDIKSIAQDQDIHVDIESEDFQKPEFEQKDDEKIPALSKEEEMQMKPYYDKINLIDTKKPKTTSKKGLEMFEAKIATHETSINQLLEWGKGKGGLNPKQVDVLEKICLDKLSEIKKLQKAYGFGPKNKKS